MFMKAQRVYPTKSQNMTDGLFLNALPVLMLATVFFVLHKDLQVFWSQRGLKMDPQHGPKLDLVLGRFLEASWGRLEASWMRVGGYLELS